MLTRGRKLEGKLSVMTSLVSAPQVSTAYWRRKTNTESGSISPFVWSLFYPWVRPAVDVCLSLYGKLENPEISKLGTFKWPESGIRITLETCDICYTVQDALIPQVSDKSVCNFMCDVEIKPGPDRFQNASLHFKGPSPANTTSIIRIFH